VRGDHLISASETLEMVPIVLTSFGRLMAFTPDGRIKLDRDPDVQDKVEQSDAKAISEKVTIDPAILTSSRARERRFVVCWRDTRRVMWEPSRIL
jgi:hypothetical protein